MPYYKFMLGAGSRYADECFLGSFIGVWYEIDEDLTEGFYNREVTREEFEMRYLPLLEERNRGRPSCNQLWKFYREMNIGDIVICPDGGPYDSFYIGEIVSDYYFTLDHYQNGEIQPHRRRVRWFDYKINRDELSDRLKATIRQPVTIINLSNNYNDEMETLLHEKNKTRVNIPEDNNTKLQKYTILIRKYLDQNVIGLLLSQFLENTLQLISNDWWQELVIRRLSEMQYNIVRRNNIHNLDRLDNATLLSILIQNMSEITRIVYLIEEDKNTIFLMKNIRNRIEGHFTGYNDLFDILRDFDTILRFLRFINIEQDDIQKIINEIKKIILDIMRDILLDDGKTP